MTTPSMFNDDEEMADEDQGGQGGGADWAAMGAENTNQHPVPPAVGQHLAAAGPVPAPASAPSTPEQQEAWIQSLAAAGKASTPEMMFGPAPAGLQMQSRASQGPIELPYSGHAAAYNASVVRNVQSLKSTNGISAADVQRNYGGQQ
jgi:hypothetical protein